ncbi:NADPH-dependent FMN reductase [Paraburkholderia bryophila]|uniref:FMN reductase n=1 Tax=Paraburkholderia bryophila TaxID=420952 RepID=A0A7Y9WAG6_9BURK|nr:FMN reductase [Paraburkholderia bryophila]
MKVVALGGSLRINSFSAAALRAGLAVAAQRGATTEMLDLRLLDLPLYAPDTPVDSLKGAARDAVGNLIEGCRNANVMIWASPTYHGAMSGAPKNAIDYLQHLAGDSSPYLQGKAVGIISIADPAPLASMAGCVHELRAWLAPTRLTLNSQDFSPSLDLTDERATRRMTRLVEELLMFRTAT